MARLTPPRLRSRTRDPALGPARSGRPGQNVAGIRAEELFGFNAEPYVRTGRVQKVVGLLAHQGLASSFERRRASPWPSEGSGGVVPYRTSMDPIIQGWITQR